MSIKQKTKDVVKITDRTAPHVASKFGDLQELVRIIRDKEQMKLKRLRKENERILDPMDNNSDDIDVDSEEDDATVEQILKWMKLHIEEKFGIELEAT